MVKFKYNGFTSPGNYLNSKNHLGARWILLLAGAVGGGGGGV